MFGLGTSEIIIVLVIALLVFGPQKLPEIGRQIGGLMREFRRMSDDVRRTFDVEELTGLNRYDDPLSSASYHPATSYEPDLGVSHEDAAYPRLDQQMPGPSGIDEIKTVPRTNGHGGAAVYDSPRPWSLSDDNPHDEFDSAGTSHDIAPHNLREMDDAGATISNASSAAHFTPVVSAAPPGPPSASNGGNSSSNKEQ